MQSDSICVCVLCVCAGSICVWAVLHYDPHCVPCSLIPVVCVVCVQGPFVYELFSIMIHSGSAAGGHYYAYVKLVQRWSSSLFHSFVNNMVEPLCFGQTILGQKKQLRLPSCSWGHYLKMFQGLLSTVILLKLFRNQQSFITPPISRASSNGAAGPIQFSWFAVRASPSSSVDLPVAHHLDVRFSSFTIRASLGCPIHLLLTHHLDVQFGWFIIRVFSWYRSSHFTLSMKAECCHILLLLGLFGLFLLVFFCGGGGGGLHMVSCVFVHKAELEFFNISILYDC